MKVMIFTSSPNKEGLTAACGEQARQGAAAGGAEISMVRLNDLSIGMCRACGSGWGTCLEQHTCQVEDDFQALHSAMKEMDGFIFATPVYWGDPSESAKAFLDRVRRCEGFKKENCFISGKPMLYIAAAGGTGNNVISCLAAMERFADHVKAKKIDFIGVTRKNKDYKLTTIFEAAKKFAKG